MSDNVETAVLAGGCYWTMQQLLRHRDGVLSTRVGWTGGENDNPSEEDNSGHAEAVKVTFDPERLSYRDLLEFFFLVHRADLNERIVGSGYRSENLLYERRAAQGGRANHLGRRRLGPLARQDRDQDQRCRPLLGGRGRRSGLLPAISGRLHAPLSRAGVEAANRETATS